MSLLGFRCLVRVRSDVKRDRGLQVDERIAELVEMSAELRVSLRTLRALTRNRLRFSPQGMGRHDIELSRLVDAFTRVFRKQTVAPCDEIVEVGHHGLEHESGLPVTRNQERAKGVLRRGPDAVDRVLVEGGIRACREIDKSLLD